MGEAEAVDGHVGGGVVAEDDHEGEGVAEGEGERSGELGQDAGAFDLVVVIEDQLFGKGRLAGADLFGGVEQDAELDGGGGLDGQIGGEGGGLAGAQVVGVDGELAVVGGGDGLELLVELLVFIGRLSLTVGKSGRQDNRTEQRRANKGYAHESLEL